MNKEILQELIEKGYSTYKMGEELGVAQTTIRYWLKKYELKSIFTPKIPIINGIKTCTKCNLPLSIENFYFKKKENYYHSSCKSCLNKQILKRQRGIKEKALEYKGNSCIKCGYNKYVGALQFHHIDKKDIDWKNFKMRKFNNQFKKELDKCIVLCANCHIEEHHLLEIMGM